MGHPSHSIDGPVHAGRFDDEGDTDPEPVAGSSVSRAVSAIPAPDPVRARAGLGGTIGAGVALLGSPRGIGRAIESALKERRIIAAVVQRSAGALMGKLIGAKEVPAPDLHGIETHGAGDPGHESLGHERPEREPHASIRPGREPVGGHGETGVVVVGHPIWPGKRHPGRLRIERAAERGRTSTLRHRRAPAPGGRRGARPHPPPLPPRRVASREWNAVCRCSIRSWTHFTARPSRMARAAVTTSSGKSCILGPKPPPTSGATTRIRFAASPRLRERPSPQKVGDLGGGEELERPVRPIVRGHRPAPLHRHARDARVPAGEADPDRHPLEPLPFALPTGRPLGAEQDVVRRVLVQAERVPAGRRAGVRDHRERVVLDLDEGGRVLGEVAAVGGDHGHDLSRVAHRVRCHRMPVGRPEERRSPGRHLRPDGSHATSELRPAHHCRHPRRAARPPYINGADPRMRPGAARERKVERARRAEIVEKTPPPAEERPMLGGAGVGHAGGVMR